MANPSRPSRAITVLLVDDSPSDVALTQEVVAHTEHEIIMDTASDGVEAIAYLQQRSDSGERLPDIILLDLNMPRMGGHEVLDTLKDHKDWRRIPVIVLTTSQASADIIGTYDRHANSYITKPVDLADFIEVVKRIEGYWLSVVQLPSQVES